jgi:hypothetical protein
VRFGTGSYATVPEIEVKWPSGARQRLGVTRVDRVIQVAQP